MSGYSCIAMLPLVLALGLPSVSTAADDRPVLELSLDEAVKRALENNTDIAVQKYSPDLSGESVRASLGAYDPLAFSSLNQNSQTTPATNAFSGGAKVEQKTFNFNFGVTQYAPTGASFRLEFDNSRTSTTSVFTTFNPGYQSTLTASVTQPLLRNLSIDSSRQQIKVAKKNKEISDVQFHQTVVVTIATVKQQYFSLIAAIDSLDSARKSLTLAKKLLDENQIKVKVGTMAPLDVVTAESEVATREEGVIVAEAAITDAEDVIKSAIFPKNDPTTWNVQIVPTDHPAATFSPVDIEGALKTALEKRTDLVAARKGIETNQINLDFARNQTRPQLDLVASYGTIGVGGTQLVRQGFGGPVTQEIPGGYGDATSQVFGRDFPTWKVGVNFTYPIGNRQAAALGAQARLTKEQAEVALRRLELQVAAEVRAAGRAVQTNFKRVEATHAARILEERRTDAEEKKFAAGMSTNFLVTQAQRDLAVAEANEIQAIADYHKSIVNFDRSLEAGLSSGGPGTITVSAPSQATATGSSTSSTASTTTASRATTTTSSSTTTGP